MAHINNIGAGLFSDLAIAVPTAVPNFSTLDTKNEFDALFATEIESVGGSKAAGAFVRVKDVRQFPSMGTPANIVKVPVYGSRTSQQIQGQADAPSLELTVNYIPAHWATGTVLGDMVGDGNQYAMRFALLNSEPTGFGVTKYASLATGLGTVANSEYYWIGKLEALLVNPQLTDANTATVTLSAQSKFYGAYTVEA